MYLKRLEIQGFKSFADKINIDFSKGLTMVVGPNGSGKSNVCDAIRWVLGEQSSKTLRGQKMEDVIFMGTDDRNAVTFSKVTLVIDNTDGKFPYENSEISISRQYYRSGESKYFINKKECRLLDINAIFMDTGLSRDGYSIIGQGRIDEILSLKSKDRRDFFDEATGITKYRFRKDEAQKKLELTEENLVRLLDILYERENRIEPLRKQSEIYEKFKLLSDELRVYEVNMWVSDIFDINSKLVECETEKTKTSELIYDNKVSYNKILLEIDKINIEINKIDSKITVINDEMHKKTLQFAENTAKMKEYDIEITHKNQNKERIINEIYALEEEVSNIKHKNLQVLNNAENFEQEKLQILNNLSEKQQKLTILEQNSQQINKRINEQDLSSIKNQIEDELYNLNTLKNQYNFNKNALENNDYYAKPIKSVLNNKDLAGIVGAVSSCIQTEEIYTNALEASLGGAMQNIITENTIYALKAIDYLKASKNGTATFLPIDKVFGTKQNFDKFKNNRGVIGNICDIIKFEQKIQNVVYKLLGNTLLVENSDTAVNILKTNDIKIVTLDGEIFHKGGAISGGRRQNNFSHLKQTNLLAKLKLQVDDAKIKYEKSCLELANKTTIISQLQAEFDKVNNEKQNVKLEMSSINGQIDILNHKIASQESLKTGYENQKAEIQLKITSKKRETYFIDDEVFRLKKNLATLKQNTKQVDSQKAQEDIAKLMVLKDEFKIKIKEQNRDTTKVTDERIGLEKTLVSLENDINVLNEKKENIQNNLSDKYALTYTQALKIKNSEYNYTKIKQKVYDLNRQIRELGPINTEATAEYEKVLDEYNSLKTGVDDVQKSKDEIEKILGEIESEMSDIFMNEFNALNKNFTRVFQDLFGGGSAYLELSDKDDILGSGIEINVCPPGKKHKSLSLLSGGERAFVAIAIFFSILKLRPTPFCVLDEIDAALDDINVHKYGIYLKKHASDTQFIVITHRKGTMKEAETLYGVTMENKGISKLLKMELNN